MTKKIDIYSREFSQITGLQNREIITYRLCKTQEEDLTVYGIELGSLLKDKYINYEKNKKNLLERISCSKELVLDVLKYLYENSIKPESAYSIVTDILNTRKCRRESSITIG